MNAVQRPHRTVTRREFVRAWARRTALGLIAVGTAALARRTVTAPAREAVMEVTLETRGPDHAAQIMARLEEAGYSASLGD